MIRSASIFVALAVAVAAHAQHDGHGGKGKGAPRPDLGASAAFARDGTLWAVFKEGEHVMASSSRDAGRTWSRWAPVNAAPEPVAADGDSRPKVATGPGGEVYVTWTRPLAKPYTGFIRFSRSTDGGRTFAAPVTLHADRREITHRFDALAVNGDGRLFVAWIDKRDQVDAGKAGGYRGAAVYFAVSADRGATFTPDTRVAHHSCECCRIAMLPRADGSVTALWRHVFEPNLRDHAMARLGADGKPGDLVRATYDDWRLDACPHHGPSLAEGAEGALHAVWFTGAKGREGVHYGRLGEGPPKGLVKVGGVTAEHADVAAIGARVAVVWREFDGERSKLRAMRSDDNGRTWNTRELAATASATDHPKVLAHEGRFYAFWNTRERPLSVTELP